MDNLWIAVIAAAYHLIANVVFFWLGRSSRPLQDVKEAVESVKGTVRKIGPAAKGRVIGFSDKELAHMEMEKHGWDEPHDPNEGVPAYESGYTPPVETEEEP